MHMGETYFAVVPSGDDIPAQYEWFSDQSNAESDAIDLAKDDNHAMEIYRIEIKRIKISEVTVTLRDA